MRSPQFMNCINYYEIDLRGNKITIIENLGATENQFDSIDLSDNAIVRLEGFPRLHRLKCLLLNNNRITRIARQLEDAIPHLDTLVLTSNRLAELKDLDPLASLPRLKLLSLVENPVTKKPNYRLYVISKLPGLKILDYKKVKQQEREQAQAMFGKAAGEQQQEAANGTKTFEPEEDLREVTHQREEQPAAAAHTDEEQAQQSGKPRQPTAEQITAVKAAIANAQTLEEVRRLEEALKKGHMPSEFEFKPQTKQSDEAISMDEG